MSALNDIYDDQSLGPPTIREFAMVIATTAIALKAKMSIARIGRAISRFADLQPCQCEQCDAAVNGKVLNIVPDNIHGGDPDQSKPAS